MVFNAEVIVQIPDLAAVYFDSFIYQSREKKYVSSFTGSQSDIKERPKCLPMVAGSMSQQVMSSFPRPRLFSVTL